LENQLTGADDTEAPPAREGRIPHPLAKGNTISRTRGAFLHPSPTAEAIG
jgi:hypothetical protein